MRPGKNRRVINSLMFYFHLTENLRSTMELIYALSNWKFR